MIKSHLKGIKLSKIVTARFKFDVFDGLFGKLISFNIFRYDGIMNFIELHPCIIIEVSEVRDALIDLITLVLEVLVRRAHAHHIILIQLYDFFLLDFIQFTYFAFLSSKYV